MFFLTERSAVRRSAANVGAVGRDAELEAAMRFFEDPDGRALLFGGEAGIGKTTLWSAAVDEAHARGWTVLAARVVEAETELAFATLGDLLEPVDAAVFASLPSPQRRALDVALLRVEPGERRLDLRAVGAATTGVLRELASGAPVVLAIDDVQWLDRSSARVLGFALRRLEGAAVCVVAAERIGVSRVGLDLEQALSDVRVTRVEVGPLSVAALHAVLKARLERSLGRRTLLRVDEATGGNPFFALEIARTLPDDIAPGAPLPVPANLIELVEERMARLGANVRTHLLVAAALSAPTLDLIAAATGTTPAGTLAALEPAVAAGVIELDGRAVRFAHPLYAAALYSSAPLSARRATHARLAAVLDGLEERAGHLALAADGPDAATAASLDEAAERARRRGAPDVAAALAEEAVALTPPGDRSLALRRTITAAEYRHHAGELERARAMLDEVLGEELEPATRAEALRQLADVIAHQTSVRDAAPVFEEALELTDDPAVAAAIELQLAFNANASADFVEAEAHATRALALAMPLGTEGGLAEALAVAEIARFQLGRGVVEANLERALALEDPDRLVTVELRPSLIAGLIMMYVGNLERSIELLREVRARVLERGDDSSLPVPSGSLAWACCWRGEIEAGSAYAAEALECATRIGSESFIAWSLGYAAVAAAFAGDAEECSSRAEACLAAAGRSGFGIAPLWAGWAIALTALAQGDADAADAALAPFVPPFEANGVGEPIIGFFLPDAIEAMIRTGQLDRAERLLASFESAARRLDRGWALAAAGRCRALLESARGELAPASEAARAAIELGESLELRIDFARTLLLAGQIERRRRRKQAAAELIGRACAIFEASGARLWAAQARYELDRSTPNRADGGLTDAERRVAELAASGLTNREVAAQLFLSTKTVEANLQRAYRKLGIRSRAELGARFAEAAAPRRET
jgi:DNA-binding CsgD family transcriptional regulator